MTPSDSTRQPELPPPVFSTRDEYRARLADPSFWTPYVFEVLRRHELPLVQPETGSIGTFPTFLVGRYVVKLFTPTLAKPFGTLFDGTICHQVEIAVFRALAGHPSIPGPALIATGHLFQTGDGGGAPASEPPWPYLLTTRLGGTSWGEAALSMDDRTTVARQLGSILRQVHALPPPAGPLWERDWIAEYRAGCIERLRRWGTLPSHLIDQMDTYLLTPPADRRLIHADVHADHLFVDGTRIVGIIDWGDALVADPYYELPALHLGTFHTDRALLAAFLDGYGWPQDRDFARRAMSMTLLHEFDVMERVSERINLQQIATLDELAHRLWAAP
jgi:hygromycin-B 7''-O-kinase